MPPKKAGKGAAQKKTQKVVVDKTFGLKNKNKSSKVQKYINQVQVQAQNQNKKPNQPVKSKKQLKAEKDAEYNALFKPVVTKNVVKAGVDPKSVVCEYFKLGTCTKGNRCKFSHDWKVDRKGEKIDMYTDRRDVPTEDETMENWDEGKLRDVVNKKANKPANQTDIICRYFLEAIENQKYGWFWECPNGAKCIYRHALPPGFVLKSKVKEVEEEGEKTPFEDLLEAERRGLKSGTPLTLELFLQWKESKRKAREEQALKRKKDIESGRTVMSGKELFEFNPDLIGDDDDDGMDETQLKMERDEEKNDEVVEVEENLFMGGEEDIPDLSDDEEDNDPATEST